jgi:acid stress-induced BolA-like protein IbaG/YrbA
MNRACIFWECAHVTDQLIMVTPEDIKQWIAEGLPTCEVQVVGDGHHFEAHIVYAGFEGKPLVQRHRMVYATLGDNMREAVHALSIKAVTPEEQQNK